MKIKESVSTDQVRLIECNQVSDIRARLDDIGGDK